MDEFLLYIKFRTIGFEHMVRMFCSLGRMYEVGRQLHNNCAGFPESNELEKVQEVTIQVSSD